jgi:hypothetical protein
MRHWLLPLLWLGAAVGGVSGQPLGEELRLTVGGSAVIDYPADISQISTSAPAVVDAVAVSKREVLLQAKSQGSSTIVIWAKSGQRSFYRATVSQNLEPVRKLLRDTFPDEEIQVQATHDALSLTGRVRSQSVAERAAALVGSSPTGPRRRSCCESGLPSWIVVLPPRSASAWFPPAPSTCRLGRRRASSRHRAHKRSSRRATIWQE